MLSQVADLYKTLYGHRVVGDQSMFLSSCLKQQELGTCTNLFCVYKVLKTKIPFRDKLILYLFWGLTTINIHTHRSS
jgi:hypothetical protein